MILDEIKSAIVEREEEMFKIFNEENIVERENYSVVKSSINKGFANIITGIRRCGKSIFSFQLYKGENFGYVNFEDERLNIESKYLNDVLEAIYSLKGNVDLLIFDEIQNIEGWERFVARIIPTKKVIITGSNARILSGELSTFLTGRHIDFLIFPFSFREYLNFNNIKIDERSIYITEKISEIKNLLDKYIEEGGFPLVKKGGKLFLVENYKDIVERDIIQRFKIRLKNFKEFSKYVVSNYSNEITYNSLKNIFKVSVVTISNWINYLEYAYLIFTLQRYSPKLKQQILAPRKVYCIDTGIINSIGFKTSKDIGKLMENSVAVELLRRKNYWNNDWEIYYWKDYQQREVDFVIKDKEKIKQLIQVTYAYQKEDIRKREIEALIKASNELICNDLLVITYDYEDEIEFENKKIKFVPLWKWLIKFNY
ncbi:MAG: ATP-binding protein [Candidatus Altarchaeaceae archaeon]